MDNDDTIDTLNTLIETSLDGEYGFRTSAEHAKNVALKQVFDARADECQRGAAELQGLVVQLGGTAEDSGSASGSAHRGWVAVKSTLTGYSDQALLDETERGEDVALARYRKAIEKGLPPSVLAVVERQLQGVQRNHDQIRDLRNAERARA